MAPLGSWGPSAVRRWPFCGDIVRAVVDLFAGVTEEVRAALVGVPESERAPLELRLSWRALGEHEALIAARLRVFVLTSDPFASVRRRSSPSGWALAQGGLVDEAVRVGDTLAELYPDN
jgi:hypothetical protein